MITGINLAQTEEFISDFDKGEQKTVWLIGVMPSRVSSYVAGLFQSCGSVEGMVEVVQFGLKGFRNFKDTQGNEIVFDTTQRPLGNKSYAIVKQTITDLIPTEIIVEIGSKILSISKLQEQEIKN